jgi:hypothetical protein
MDTMLRQFVRNHMLRLSIHVADITGTCALLKVPLDYA